MAGSTRWLRRYVTLRIREASVRVLLILNLNFHEHNSTARSSRSKLPATRANRSLDWILTYPCESGTWSARYSTWAKPEIVWASVGRLDFKSYRFLCAPQALSQNTTLYDAFRKQIASTVITKREHSTSQPIWIQPHRSVTLIIIGDCNLRYDLRILSVVGFISTIGDTNTLFGISIHSHR